MTNPTPLYDKVAQAAQKAVDAHAALHTSIHTHAHRHAAQRAARLRAERANRDVADGGKPAA